MATISSIVLENQTASGLSAKCTTDTGTGSLYGIVDVPGADPTAAQIVAGNNSSDTPALAAGNVAISAIGQTDPIAFTGLSAGTSYQCWLAQDDTPALYVFSTDFSGYDTTSQTLQQLEPSNFGDYFTTILASDGRVQAGGLGAPTNYATPGFSHPVAPQFLGEDQYMQFRLNYVPSTGNFRCTIRSQGGPGNVNRITIVINPTTIDIRAQNSGGSFQFSNLAHGSATGVIWRFEIVGGIFQYYINGVEQIVGGFDYGNSSSVDPYRSSGPSIVSVAVDTYVDLKTLNIIDDFECGEL